MAVALVDRARTKLPSVSAAGVGGELVPCDMRDERSVTLRNTVADTVQTQNSLERMPAHQQATLHHPTFRMAAQLNCLLNVIANLSRAIPNRRA
jgi:hypothetical protein